MYPLRSLLCLTLFVTAAPARATDVADLQRAMLETDLRQGQTAAALTRELELYFPNQADRDFVHAHRPPAGVIKPRAVERLDNGYRLTWADGRLSTFEVTPEGRVTLEKTEMPDHGAGVKPVFDAAARALRLTHAAARGWFGIERAEAAPVDLTNGIVMLSVFTVVLLQKSAKKGAKTPRITDLLNHGVELCERENFEGLAFEESKTGRMMAQLEKMTTFDFTHESTAESCQLKIIDALTKNEATTKKLGVSKKDLMSGCASAVRLTTCVREYRKRKGQQDQPFAPAAPPTETAH